MSIRTTLWTLVALLLGLTATGHAASNQTDPRSTRTVTVFFLGTITSVNMSNHTITVDGAPSVIVNTVVQKKNDKISSAQPKIHSDDCQLRHLDL